MFNGTSQLAGMWRAASGYHRLTARVSPPIGDDVDGTNNEATSVIGVPAMPTDLAGSADALNKSMGVAWQPVSGPVMSHYHVYRAEGTGAFLKLGDTTETWFRDKTVQPGRVYRYAVSAVSDANVESPRSAGLSLTAIKGGVLAAHPTLTNCVSVSPPDRLSVRGRLCGRIFKGARSRSSWRGS